MRHRPWFLAIALVTVAPSRAMLGQPSPPQIPKVWDDDAVERMTLPVIGLGKSPTTFQLSTTTEFQSREFRKHIPCTHLIASQPAI
jgi:hypothetical protein